MKSKLVIWGAGGHAKVVADALKLIGRHDLIGCLDDVTVGRIDDEFCGVPLFHRLEQLAIWRAEGIEFAFVAVGENAARENMTRHVQQQGFRVPAIIHPQATVAATATVSSGAFVGVRAIVGADARIGVGAIINSGTIVEHDCEIGDFASIGPGAVLGGCVRVGNRSLVGLGASILPQLAIGDGVVIGAGAVVTKEIQANSVAVGVPARVIREGAGTVR